MLPRRLSHGDRRGAHPPPTRRGRIPRIECKRTAAAGPPGEPLPHPVESLQKTVACIGRHRDFGCYVGLNRFGNASCAGKTSNEALLSYSCSGVVRNGPRENGFERFLREPASPERTGGVKPCAEPSRLPERPLALGLQCVERRLRCLQSDPLLFQVGPDPLVAVAPAGEAGSAVSGEASVVEVAGAGERLDGVLLRLGRDPGALELGAQRLRGVVPPRERPGGTFERGIALDPNSIAERGIALVAARHYASTASSTTPTGLA